MSIMTQAVAERRAHGRVYNLGCKYETMEHYSKGPPCCVDCGCHDLRVLELDHTNDDGYEERREHSFGCGSTAYYQSLHRRGYPDDLGLEVRCKECHNKRPKPSRKIKFSQTLCIEFDYANPIPPVRVQSLWEVEAR